MADRVEVTISGTSAGLESAMRDASSSVKDHSAKIKESLEGAKSGIEGMRDAMKSFTELAGIGIAVEAIKMVGEALIRMGERAIEIRTMSEVLNVTTTQFQGMGEAAEEAGVSEEKLFRATERIVGVLDEARAGSAAAIEKITSLGITLDQVNDKSFGTAQMLAALSARLNDSATAGETMSALTKELGPRAAIAAIAIKALGDNVEHWNEKAAEANALTEQQLAILARAGIEAKQAWKWVENATMKTVAFGSTVVAGFQGVSGVLHQYANAALDAADAAAKLNKPGEAGNSPAKQAREDAKAQLESIKDQIAAVKAGTAEKLALLQQYAAAALKYYGSGEVDAVREANRAVSAETVRFNDEQERARKEDARKETQAYKEHARAQAEASRDKLEIARKLIADSNKLLDEDIKQTAEAIATQRDLRLADLADQASELRERFAAGELTRNQELAGEIDLANRKYVIEAQSLQERLALTEADSLARAKLLGDLELLERQHSLAIADIQRQGALDSVAMWNEAAHRISAAMQPALASFLNFSTSVKTMFRDMATAIGNSMAQTAARNITLMVENMAKMKTLHLKEIASNAYRAAAGAYASVVGIPYVGPILAPAAAAVAFGSVMAFASAKGGYDIPTGVNPITQLHSREMVLPEKQADAVRAMADGGGGPPLNITVKQVGQNDMLISRGDLMKVMSRFGSPGYSI
ncbi:MAG: hypothetical protein ABI645_00460 [Pseudomonadota bacterium]